MLIGIDLDEVLGDTLSAVIQFHNETYGTTLVRKQFHSYRWWEVWGGTREESIDKFFAFTKTAHFTNLQPFKEAIDAIDVLSKKHQLVVITSRQVELLEETTKWIEKHFPHKFHDIFVTNHAHWAKSGKSTTKAEICKKHNVDILIEDNLDYAYECISNKTKVILLDYPWNQGKLPKGAYRVHSWKEVPNNKILKNEVYHAKTGTVRYLSKGRLRLKTSAG